MPTLGKAFVLIDASLKPLAGGLKKAFLQENCERRINNLSFASGDPAFLAGDFRITHEIDSPLMPRIIINSAQPPNYWGVTVLDIYPHYTAE